MIPVLAHNPELILLLLGGLAVASVVVPTLVYTVLSALGFMLAGWGLKVSWWWVVFAVLFLFPVFHCRFFLHFSWWRAALAAGIIVLLHIVFFVLLVTLLAYCFPQYVIVAS